MTIDDIQKAFQITILVIVLIILVSLYLLIKLIFAVFELYKIREKVDLLEQSVDKIEDNFYKIVIEQETQTQILQEILKKMQS